VLFNATTQNTLHSILPYLTTHTTIFCMGAKLSSCKLRDKHSFKVSENRVLGETFALEREKVIGGWKRLHNEKLHNSH
jgi:hypothetical protein